MPDVSRRRLLQLLGVAPAIPLIAKMPVMEPVPMPEMPAAVPVEFSALQCTGNFITASGGWCATPTPLYEYPNEFRPVRDSLPAVRLR